ncbi:MAG TPA: alpha/beta hydrolase [Thermoanaerobaculia bacterium]|nr:alpha/beta hydrolase [Thermoanaerobaculia bacterium]
MPKDLSLSRRISLALLLAAVAGFPLLAQAPPPMGPVEAATTPPHPCKVPGVDEEVRCATYAVWENREAKKGRKIGINVVILPAKGPEKLPDPLFFFGGGPGQGIAGEAPGLAQLPERKRDVVLIDQRGTGRSNTLDCEFWGHPLDLRKAAGEFLPIDAVRACKARLEKVADLRYYTTPLAIDDVDEIRAWLGYGKINLSGGSYGTRAAEVYLQRHPESVRTVTLIAVAPLDEYLPLHHAYAGQRALDLLLAECAADTACHTAFPNVKEEIKKVMERVDQGVTVALTNPVTKEKQEVRPTHGLVAEGIRFLMYGQGGGALPLQIHQAFEGNLTPLIQMSIERRLGIDDALAMGMLFSVTCAEDLPFIDDATAAQATKGTILGDYRIRQQKEVCKVWPRGEIPANLHTPVHSGVPVLLIAGERDPVTPPEFAERAAKYLSNSLLVVVPHGTHGGAGDCTNQMISKFLDTASVKGIDTSCLQKLPPTRFVTSG